MQVVLLKNGGSSNVMSMWSLRWQFTNKSITGAPYSITGYSYSLSHSWTLWWRVRWLKQCRLDVAAELQQRWRRTNRRQKSIPRLSSSYRESSITQSDASCGRYDQRRRRSTSKMPTHIVSWLANLLCLLGRISSSSASTWGKALCRRLTTLLLPTRPASRLTTFSRSRIAWRTCTTTGQEQSECLHRARYVSRDDGMQKWLWWHFCYRWSK